MVKIGLPNNSLHAKSEEDTRKTFCAICNVNCCTPIQLKEHLNGKPHKARMLRKKYVANEDQNTTRNLMCSKDSTVAVNLVGPRQTPLITPILGPNEMRCDICHIVCSGRQPFLLHINGKQHKKALKKHQEAFPFWQQPEVEYPPPDYSHIVSYLTEEQSATDYSDRFDLSDEKLSQDKVEEKDIGKRIKII
uniref:U1-type domain-containing protein n=1 Tax=Acrobeloides nanus TaxID=290746 RepID=A0A914C6Z1_9BILA